MRTVFDHTFGLAVRAERTWLIMNSPLRGAAEGCSESTMLGLIQLTWGRVSFLASAKNSSGQTGRKAFLYRGVPAFSSCLKYNRALNPMARLSFSSEPTDPLTGWYT